MASIAQPFPGQPGMVGPGGVAQPMVHGHPSNHGMPGAQHMGLSMGQPVHPGATGPGGMPMSQAGPMVPGMIPGGAPPGVSGAGPNAHAMSHLHPHGPMLNQQMQQASEQAPSNLIFLGTYLSRSLCCSDESHTFKRKPYSVIDK